MLCVELIVNWKRPTPLVVGELNNLRVTDGSRLLTTQYWAQYLTAVHTGTFRVVRTHVRDHLTNVFYEALTGPVQGATVDDLPEVTPTGETATQAMPRRRNRSMADKANKRSKTL
jgi:hypothetical protein